MQVDSVNKQGLLLEVVQVLTDMNLNISKSYISSDAGWFMDGIYIYIYYIYDLLSSLVFTKRKIWERCTESSCRSHKWRSHSRIMIRTTSKHDSEHNCVLPSVDSHGMGPHYLNDSGHSCVLKLFARVDFLLTIWSNLVWRSLCSDN